MGLLFNGTTQYIRVSSCPVTVTPLTMSFWVKSPVLTNNTTYINLGSTIASDFSCFQLVFVGSWPQTEVTTSTASVDSLKASTLASVINTVYHVCGVFTSTTSRTIYVNGSNSATDVTSCLPTSSSLNTTSIGVQMNEGVNTGFVNANIYFAAIWNSALSASDVTSLSLGISPRKIQPSNLVRYSRMTGHNSPEPDLMNSTGWTVTAAPTESANVRMYFP